MGADERGDAPHHAHSIDVEKLEHALVEDAFEGLDESIAHDYSTSDAGVVPLNRRRPLLHFWGIWMTFSAGFSFLFVGTQIYAGGHSLASTVAIVAVGVLSYLIYGMFAAYVGSRSGQTHALLTRSIFGVSGSAVVSIFAFVGALGFVGFQANLLAQIWDGLYGWGHVELFSIVIAFVMVFNNIFGFTGISAYARYVVTPLLVLWIYFLVIKGVAVDGSHFGGTPHTSGLAFFPAVGVVIGFCMWGNEPDLWRYGKPTFSWPFSAYVFGLIFGFSMCAIGGWFMADLAHSTEFSTIVRFTVHYSFFGVFFLAFIVATVSQVAINDGNYYESINALQNLLGGWRRWKRLYSCLTAAAFGALMAWIVNYELVSGFTTITAFLAITVPTATIIMCVDHFLLPRLFGISRPLLHPPAWRDAGIANVPAVAALLVAVILGAFGTGIMPGASSTRYWGDAPAETWILGGVLYIIFVAIARAVVNPSKIKGALGFSRPAIAFPVMPGEVIDITTTNGDLDPPTTTRADTRAMPQQATPTP
jgi:purine-cytosine permease-like protein